MESFEEPGQISRENLLEVPTLNDSLSEDEDVKSAFQPRFSPSPRRRNSDSSEEAEPEAPSTIARKVSFADAFGYDLVSVKEFDTWEVPTTLPNDDLEDEVVPVEEFYLTPLFTLPTTQEELLQKVRAQKVWLESIEFLPGITCMKGIIRVLNISFEKLVYVRMSLDNWLTYYDILAEYVPNSCDGETDQFFFKISLVPPYQRDGAKVEFCVRYETSAGIFWANYNHHNYTLICHKKETAPVEDTKLQEDTDKYIKGCLKSVLNSKEEILATADEDIWNNSKASESNIPKIRCLDVDDNEIKQSKEQVKDQKEEHIEDDNEDNEKELELLLRHHFTRNRDSSRDESNVHISEPVKFPNDPQDLGDKVDSGLVRQPLPITSLQEHVLQEQELQNTPKYSIGYDYSQLSHEKYSAVELVNSSAQSSECFNTSKTLLSQEHWPRKKENQAAYITDVISSKQEMNHTDLKKDETDSTSASKTIEKLFISEDDYDKHQEVWERRPETVPLNPDEPIQLKEILKGLGDSVKPDHKQCVPKTDLQIESSLENVVKHEPKKEMIENKNQFYLRGTIHDNTFPDVDTAVTSLGSLHTEGDAVEEKYKTEYNIDMGKEIKLSILEHPPEEEQAHPLTTKATDTKDLTEIQSQSWLSSTDSYEFGPAAELSQGEIQRPSSELSEVQDEAIHESTKIPWLNDKESSVRRNKEEESSIVSKDFKKLDNRHSEDTNPIQFCTSNPECVTSTDEGIATHSASINQEDVFDAGGNLERGKYSQSYNPENRNILEAEPCQNEPDRAITDDHSNEVGLGNQSWSALESQSAERESEANKRAQMKERTGGEAMWGIRDNIRCLNVTPTDELFTCQDPVRYEEYSVAEYDSTREAEAGTAAYIIKMTSESTPEKMSAGEKAVIVKLPQETALSDRPTEEKETVFDIHEGRNDGSHYPLCQCNTVGVLYDTKFEKESISDIYNAHTHETVQGEMMSVPSASEKLAGAEHNTENDSPLVEILWTSAAEGKTILEQDLSSEASLNVSQCPQPDLYNEQAEEKSIWGTFPPVGTITEHIISPPDINVVASSYESASIPSSEQHAELDTDERGNTSHLYMESSVDISARLGGVFSPKSEMTDFIPNISSEAEPEHPQSSAMLPTGVEGERSVGEFVHQPELKLGKFLGPTILISEPTEEREETSSEGITEEKILNLNTGGYDNQPRFDHAEISGQQNEASSLAGECLILKQIGYEILYFLIFVVFCVALYHYDLIVCFALYLFSLYWLYCEGRGSKESVKKK
ncbi:protein phosphatase 1 regulatory subunit 3A [Eublepharis macularius]|uniref:Protein phosphatase 1 regulatory subunit 3A n=1 Tax=Eublepharis macularius TaxID=481883 RepID=A0AA97JYT8_EUBMA|nr:protein phosphatase 1 regulatory subunit 3A [Eublepharis macularius]